VEIRAVSLDVGGIFHVPSEDGVRQALAEVGFELPPDQVLRAHYAAVRAQDAAEGEPAVVADSVYVEAFARALNIPEATVEAATTGIASYFKQPGSWGGLIEDSVGALSEIAATGVKLAVVSNSDGTVEQRLREEGILQVGKGRGVPVTAVIDSGRVGVAKPDPRIFDHALQALEIAPESMVHVGDSVLADIVGARAARVRALHLDPFAECEHDDHEHVRSLRDVVDLIEASRRSLSER
jgi:putative hydrolase of the HAD superfamily